MKRDTVSIVQIISICLPKPRPPKQLDGVAYLSYATSRNNKTSFHCLCPIIWKALAFKQSMKKSTSSLFLCFFCFCFFCYDLSVVHCKIRRLLAVHNSLISKIWDKFLAL